MAELHGEGSPSLGDGAQGRGVAEHAGERDLGGDDLNRASARDFLHLALPGVQVTDDLSHELLRHQDLGLHDGFEQDGVRLMACPLKGHACCHAKGHVTRVHLVNCGIEQGGLHIDHGVAQERAAGGGLLDSFSNGAEVGLAQIRVGAVVVESHAASPRQGGYGDADAGEGAGIAADVLDALKKNYPDDQATGFEEGDLRGWFWVEVGGP